MGSKLHDVYFEILKVWFIRSNVVSKDIYTSAFSRKQHGELTGYFNSLIKRNCVYILWHVLVLLMILENNTKCSILSNVTTQPNHCCIRSYAMNLSTRKGFKSIRWYATTQRNHCVIRCYGSLRWLGIQYRNICVTIVSSVFRERYVGYAFSIEYMYIQMKHVFSVPQVSHLHEIIYQPSPIRP